MASSSAWDVMRELAAMHERMNRVWSGLGDQGHDDVTGGGAWQPAVDVYATAGKEIVLKAELPGLRREDIDLTIEQNTLTLKGQRRRDPEIQDERCHRMERAYGGFSRSFSLPNTVDPSRVRADYRDGVLTVTLPVREDAQPRQIQVDVTA